MAQKPFTSETVVEALSTFESGVDSGVAPQLLKANQLSFGTNLTVRGAFASHRPPFAKQTLDYGGDAVMQTRVEQGHFQGWCYYKPDNILTPIPYVVQQWTTVYAMEQIVASISGRIFVFTPDTTIPLLWHVTDVTIPGDANDPNAPQVWLWQAEKWIIITDGSLKLPIFYNGTSCRRSIGNDMNVLAITQAGTDANYVANGGIWNITLQAAPAAVWALGTPISGVEIGEYVVSGLGGLPTQYALTRISARGPVAGTPAFVSPNTFQNIYPELPAGRVGCYGMGRVWMSLTDAKQFIGGDINGGPSGTLAEGYRDAVLHASENSLIAGGGAFSTPGAWGDIRAMIFAATLDVSLGQGPLQVLTPTKSFSCYAPTDRTTWQSVSNPILTESLITNGSETFYGTVQANGDIIFRSVDGIRTLVLGRRDFATWGNVPASSEMDRILSLDAVQYLRYVSAIVFDNRLLMTCSPNSLTGKGVFFNGLLALNFDPLSNLRGKLPAAFDGLWTGLNILQLLVGRFNNIERAFAFTTRYDPTNPNEPSELYEILPTPRNVYSPISVFEETNWQPDTAIYDNGTIPIVWTGESSVLFKAANPKDQDFHRLIDGEILVDNLQGSVDFAVFYKPDQYPCWTPWFQWTECAVQDSSESKAQFRPRMGLGEPSSKPCDVNTKRALREGYTFQVKFIIQGHCRFLGFRAKSITLPQPAFAAPNCKPFCSDPHL